MAESIDPSKLSSLEIDESAVRAAEEYRRRKVTSVLAIMFTDIAGSTELREKLGEVAYEIQREACDEIIRDLVESERAGAVVKSTGDGALAVFAEPSEAVSRALEIQESLASHSYFELRIGIDLGQVTVNSQSGIIADVFGRQVNRAARIESIAQPKHCRTKVSPLIHQKQIRWCHFKHFGVWTKPVGFRAKPIDAGNAALPVAVQSFENARQLDWFCLVLLGFEPITMTIL